MLEFLHQFSRAIEIKLHYQLTEMSDSLYSLTKPTDGQSMMTRLSAQCKELSSQLNDRDHLVMKLRSQLMEKDLYIQQLEQKLHRHQQMLVESNKQLERMRQLELQQIGHSQFQKYFECRTPTSDPSIVFDEKFLSPYRNDSSLSPISRQMKVLNDDKPIPEAQLKQLDAIQPKTKGFKYKESLLNSHRDELTSSSASSQQGFKKTSQHLTSKISQKLVVESHEHCNPLDDQVVPPQSSGSSQKLYEEFLIMGASQQDISDAVMQDRGVMRSKSSILYRYEYVLQTKERFNACRSIFRNDASSQELKMKGLGTQMMVNQFIFPFGIELKKLSTSDGNSSVNEILFANYQIDNSPNCFAIPINQNQDEQVVISKKQDGSSLLSVLNPAHTLYYVCVKFNDFIDVAKHRCNEQVQLWSHQRVVCISTKFPFLQFFFELLISFLNDVKLNRVEQYTKKGSFTEVDSDYWKEGSKSLKLKRLSQSLTSIALLNIPTFNQGISVDFYGQAVRLQIPARELIDRIEVDWAISHALQYFTGQQLVQIFFSILFEKNVVFVCRSAHILTCSIILFYKILLRPFKWVHPLITSLPEDYIDLLESPVPLIVGIIKVFNSLPSKDPLYLDQSKLPEDFPDTLFVALQEKQCELINPVSAVPLSISKFMRDKLDPCYDLIGPTAARNREKTQSISSNPLYNMVNLQCRPHTPTKIFSHQPRNSEVHSKEACYKIVGCFQAFIQQRIVQNLPKKPLYLPKRSAQSVPLLDYERIATMASSTLTNQFVGSTEFWKQLFKTQIFIYFLDEYYTPQR